MRRMVAMGRGREVGGMLIEFIYTLTVFLDDHNSNTTTIFPDSRLNRVYFPRSIRDRDELFRIAKLQGHGFIT